MRLTSAWMARIAAPAFPNGTRWSRWRGFACAFGRVATIAVAAALVLVFFWQIFLTMPHLSIYSADTPSFMQKEPQRGPAIYYFSQVVFSLWNDFYAIAVVQGVLLAAVACFLAYAIRRATGSALLALAAMVVCLFKVSLVVLTRELASDSLFSTACLGLLAAALLLFEKPTAARITLFLLFGFAASFVRSVGAAILWPLVFGLALRFWSARRRALAALAAGSVGISALTATIGFVNYGFWAPQAQTGLALICGATFVAREDVAPDGYYPHDFAVATEGARNEYKNASSLAEKYLIIDDYYCSKTWRIADATLIDNKEYWKHDCFGRVIMKNEIFERAALAAIKQNPVAYAEMMWVKLVAGVNIISSYNNFPLERPYTDEEEVSFNIALVDEEIEAYSRPKPEQNDCNRPDLMLSLMVRYADDWRNTPRVMKRDIARPLRNLFDLVQLNTVNWLFVAESTIVFGLVAAAMLRGRRPDDISAVILLFLLPTWAYLAALCLVINPIRRYMDTTSPFVYIALLAGVWGAALVAAKWLSTALGYRQPPANGYSPSRS